MRLYPSAVLDKVIFALRKSSFLINEYILVILLSIYTINSEIVWWPGKSNFIKYFYKVTPVILLIFTIEASFLPRITTMIAMVAIVLWNGKEPGGITAVITPISMACTLEQVILVAREFSGQVGKVIA